MASQDDAKTPQRSMAPKMRAGRAKAAPDSVDMGREPPTQAGDKGTATPRKHAAKPTAPKPAARKKPATRAAAQQKPDSPPAPDALRAPGPLSEAMVENLARIEALTERLVAAVAKRPCHDPGVAGPGLDLFVNAGLAWAKLWTQQPARVLEQQVTYWGKTLTYYADLQAQLARGKLRAPDADDPVAEDPPTDKRFRNPLWRTHPFFAAVRKQYEINAAAMREAAARLEMPDAVEKQRLDWLTNQLIDMFAPTNFLPTNPDAIERALETEGESLVRGLENLVRDAEASGGEMIVSLADRNAFEVGENIATTPGRVVRREKLYELIQMSPSTEQVHARPVVIFPPWINKFYVLDLKPANSLLRWIGGQGYTLFVVSWKNPDASFADVGIDDYVQAYLDVIDATLEMTGADQVNPVGYCIGGTTLALTLALMAQRGDGRVRAATFLTTLTDFSNQGEFTPFLQEDFVSGIEAEIARLGVLPAVLMSRTMSFLRPNDLVWGPAIRSYLMGESPPAFDLLFWNGDATNLPGRMAMEYIRGLCQQNLLAGEGFEVLGHRLQLKDVTVPLCAVGCETDHIAPWAESWRGVAQMGSDDKRFILSQSGHIAGIVNPPTRDKYGHYTGEGALSGTPESWREKARFTSGSWWPSWEGWLSRHAGEMVAAREPEEGFGPAPGGYVLETS